MSSTMSRGRDDGDCMVEWRRYAVGVLDKSEGVMRYAEIGGIVRMEPRVRGVPYGPSGATTVQETDAAARHAQNQRCPFSRLSCVVGLSGSLVWRWNPTG